MKRLGLLVMPLMAISLLASCNKGNNNWWNKTKSLTKDDIGKIEEIKVNGQIHKVRLIDVDKDKDANGNTIHTTWEFVNLLSDSNGYSLALQWNDIDDIHIPNHDYLNSSIRYALNKTGNANHILWAQKGGTTWSNNYKSSVLDMLDEGNPGLVNVLKVPSKYINVHNGETWEEKTVNDKLFLLSPKEMGNKWKPDNEEKQTTPYAYYKDHTSQRDAIRIKKQVNENVSDAFSYIDYKEGSGQQYKHVVDNYAGYNTKLDATGGGWYWLRSPNRGPGFFDKDSGAWFVYDYGEFDFSSLVYSNSFAIAPAFCI